MLVALAWIFGVLALLLLAFGATPVRCEFQLTRDRELRFRVLMRPLGGLTPRITVSDTARATKEKKKEPKARRANRRWGRKRFTPKAVADLARQLLGTVYIDRLSIESRFGTGDPAETGQIYGLLTPMVYGLAPTCRRTDLTLTPVFDEACLEGRVSGQVSVTPFALVPPLARFAWRVAMQ